MEPGLQAVCLIPNNRKMSFWYLYMGNFKIFLINVLRYVYSGVIYFTLTITSMVMEIHDIYAGQCEQRGFVVLL